MNIYLAPFVLIQDIIEDLSRHNELRLFKGTSFL